MTNRKNLYGYHIKNGILTVVAQEAGTVERIATLYTAGGSYRAIADTLNGEGIPYSAEIPLWNKHKVKRRLENPRYTGTDGYPAILTEVVFQAVQEQIHSKTQGYTFKEKRPRGRGGFDFSGRVRPLRLQPRPNGTGKPTPPLRSGSQTLRTGGFSYHHHGKSGRHCPFQITDQEVISWNRPHYSAGCV